MNVREHITYVFYADRQVFLFTVTDTVDMIGSGSRGLEKQLEFEVLRGFSCFVTFLDALQRCRHHWFSLPTSRSMVGCLGFVPGVPMVALRLVSCQTCIRIINHEDDVASRGRGSKETTDSGGGLGVCASFHGGLEAVEAVVSSPGDVLVILDSCPRAMFFSKCSPSRSDVMENPPPCGRGRRSAQGLAGDVQ